MFLSPDTVMIINPSLLPALLLLSLTAPVAAEESAAYSTAAKDTTTPTFDWLAGHWCGGDATRQTEEHWLPPVNGETLGLNRTLADGRMLEFEFLRIVTHEGALAYLAQPAGRPSTAFRWTAGGDTWARFENPAHDFPTRIEYRRIDDQLRAEIAGPDGKGGEQRMGFEFQACLEETVSTTD